MHYTNVFFGVEVPGLYQISFEEDERIKETLLAFARTAYELLANCPDHDSLDENYKINESELEDLIKFDSTGNPEMLDIELRNYGIVVKVTRFGDGNWYFNSSLFEKYFQGAVNPAEITGFVFLKYVQAELDKQLSEKS